jgi:hypothetical protein
MAGGLSGVSPYASVAGGVGGDAERFYLNNDPTAAWFKYMGLLGYNGSSLRSRYAQNLQNRYFNNFSAQSARQPNLGFYDWILQQSQGDPGFARDEIQQASPDMIGDFKYRSLAPKARYVIG